jgi:hypothetical protein
MKSICIFILLVFTFSCQSQNQSVYNFDPRSTEGKEFTLNDIADGIIYIPLDNKFPIGEVHYPKLTYNSIYLFSNDGIIAYNRDGRLSGRIGLRGRGPEEYVNGTDFAVDDVNGTVYIKDSGNIIKVYSSAGNFIRTISLRHFKGDISNIDYFDSKIFIAYLVETGDAKYEWTIIDTLGNVLQNKNRNIPAFVSNWGGTYGTYILDKRLYYWNSYADTVFSILPDLSIKTSFVISPGEYRLPRASFNPEKNLSLYLHLATVFETKKYFVFRYGYNKKGVIRFVEKKSRESLFTYWESNDTGGILNDIDGGISIQPKTFFEENDNEYIVGLVNPYIIKSIVQSEKFKKSSTRYPEKKKELEKLANSLKETDNPVLMMVRLKQ